MTDSDDELPIHAVRLSPRAQRDVDLITDGFATHAGDNNALLWREGFYEAVGSLATLPHLYPAPHDASSFSFETRQLIYRRSKSSIAHRVYYRVIEGGADGRVVQIVHVRYAGARSLTRREAREIEAQQ